MESDYKKPSVLKEVLKAFIPYSSSNLLLAYKPNKFFNELERKTGASRFTISSTLSRAQRNGLLVKEGQAFRITWRGKIKAEYVPNNPKKSGIDLVVFDIPETRKHDRYQFRCYLRMMRFKPIQKSVWASKYEAGQELRDVLNELRLNDYVRLFDAQEK